MIPCRLVYPLLCVCAVFGPAILFAQADAPEKKLEKLSDRLVEGHGAMVINDFDVVSDDLCRLAMDVAGQNLRFFVNDALSVEGTGVDQSAGAIIYDSANWSNFVFEMHLKNVKVADANFEVNPDSDFPEGWQKMSKFKTGGMLFSNSRMGRRIGNRLLVTYAREEGEGEDFEWLRSPESKLAAKMDSLSHEIINQSGLTFIGAKKDVDLGDFFDAGDFVDENNFRSLSDSEREWIADLAKRGKDAEYALFGLKYHDRVLEGQGHAKLAAGANLDELFDLKHADQPWDAGLGFEKQHLAGLVAVRMDAFKSAAAARAIPGLAFDEFFHFGSTRFLKGSMLRVMMELVGDSWNDLTAARMGLYENEPELELGQLSIVGIVDAKNPQQVIAELKQMSTLLSPADTDADTDAELDAKRRRLIGKLIQDLASDSNRLASRAETRLKLGGELVLDMLKPTLGNSDNAAAQVRAKRVAAAIKRKLKSRAEKNAVLDPNFWTTLNPKLEFEVVGETVDGFKSFAIKISPDPSKSEAEVQEASGVMQALFGEQWSRVSLIQVEDHFVFMIGSDMARLNRICRRVQKGENDLMKHLEGVGDGTQAGQFQVAFDPIRVDRIFGIRQRGNLFAAKKEEKDVKQKLCWMGTYFRKESVGFQALLPVEQFRYFIP